MIGESGVCNYLYNIKYTNKFRYKLIDENENKMDATQSQTQNINTYYLHQLPAIHGSLTIVDTPGFADTEVFIENAVFNLLLKTEYRNIF